ncbi:MAG: hypothetical protein ACLTST_00470 [Lachnospiraceae bacterium]
MEKLRMAIIGSGQIAQVTHIPNYQLSRGMWRLWESVTRVWKLLRQ